MLVALYYSKLQEIPSADLANKIFQEKHLISFPPDNTAEHYWIRALCRGLCGGDTELVCKFVETMPRSIGEIEDILVQYGGEDRLYSKLKIELASILVPFGKKVPPPPRDKGTRLLWQKGWLDWVSGHGIVVHSSVLVLSGDSKEICRRIWLAQQELLLPVVERIRLRVIDWLERNYGNSWIDELIEDIVQEEKENLETEIASLAHHCFRSRSKIEHPQFNTIAQLVWSWREVRNKLAHGELIDLEMMESAWLAYDEFTSRVY